jgi:DHA3 family macrolide efflux protein-like MFS transporter
LFSLYKLGCCNGILIKFTGSITAILFDGFTFLISAILIQLIETEDVANNNQDNGIMAELIDGLKLLLQNKELFTICLVCMIINAIVIPYDTLLPAIIDTYYNTEPFVLTVFNVIFSVGLIVGSFLCGLKKKKEDNMIGILSVGGVLIGLFYFAFAIISNLSINNVIKCIYMAIPLFIVSCAIAVMNTSVQVFFFKYVKKDYLARISAISTTVTMIGAPITAFALAIVSEVLKISEILVGTGIITVLVFCCLGYSLYKVRYANDKF